jgi:N-acetylmuramoyl-L-alanine amidase
VAALENASLAIEPGDGGGRSDLGFILSELRNHDYMHWSAELAELVQRDLAAVHPGPNRGVKQGPFAVITNALMPAVLIETGFISNPTEERLLGDESFHGDAARAIAGAVTTFFESYPPGRAAIQREGG